MSLTNSQVIGEMGENVATRFLKGKGFSIIERNYKRRWGELDIVAMKGGNLHFVEVKAQELWEWQESAFTPEDHMGFHKKRRLKRAMETYLVDRYKEGTEPDFQLDLVAVELDTEKKKAKVRFYEALEVE